MLASLKAHLKQSMRPIGIKNSSHIKLPSLDYIYGYKQKSDSEGADKSKLY